MNKIKHTSLPGVTTFAIHFSIWILYIGILSFRDLLYFNNYGLLFRLNTITTALFLPLVYLNMYLLIPRLLIRQKFVLYAFILLTLAIAISILAGFLLYWQVGNYPEKSDFFISINGLLAVFGELFIILCVSTVFMLIRFSNDKERKVKELQHRNLKVELSQLKSQLNPHFLFNALNCVYVLIKNQPEKAQHVLMSFSEMLSHQLYDSAEELIPLEKEIAYLKNYIDLESVRHSDKVELDWSVHGDLQGKSIAPMILMPFVENSFKHSLLSGSARFRIKIEIDVRDEMLNFRCSNYYQKQITPTGNANGIGLKNVKRRLQLLYPVSHHITIEGKESEFHVFLKVLGLSAQKTKKIKPQLSNNINRR